MSDEVLTIRLCISAMSTPSAAKPRVERRGQVRLTGPPEPSRGQQRRDHDRDRLRLVLRQEEVPRGVDAVLEVVGDRRMLPLGHWPWNP